MAKVELSEETKAETEEVKGADLLIAVAAPVDAEQLRVAATQAVLDMGQPAPSALRTVVAYPGGTEPAAQAGMDPEQTETGGALRFLPYSLPAGSQSRIPWLPAASTYQALFAMARDLGVSACAVIGVDLAALHSNFLASMMAPVLEKRCDLAMPLYALGKFDGLLNSSILAPLTRALYGRRVRFPLAPDFCLSGKMIPDLEVALQRTTDQGQSIFWPATEAAIRECGICQVYVDTRHVPSAEGIDLSTILAQTVGPLFAEMTINAPLWQRVRGSQPVETWGSAAAPRPTERPRIPLRCWRHFSSATAICRRSGLWSCLRSRFWSLSVWRGRARRASTCPTNSGFGLSTTSPWPTGCALSAVPIFWGRLRRFTWGG